MDTTRSIHMNTVKHTTDEINENSGKTKKVKYEID